MRNSTSAMDSLEGLARSKSNEREAQFMRLRDRIEETCGSQIRSIGVRRIASKLSSRGVARPDAQRDIAHHQERIKTVWRVRVGEGGEF
jgi:hypothetical protein